MTTEKQVKVWQSTPTPNLVRYVPSGTYYLRARVNGKIVREALGTDKHSIAKVKLHERLIELRGMARRVEGSPETVADVLALLAVSIESDPTLKSRTKLFYREVFSALSPGMPAAVPQTALQRLGAPEMAKWWSVVAKGYSAQRANHHLMVLRRAMALAKKLGAITSDPTADLKRLKVPRTRLEGLVTPEQLRAVVASIREQGKAHSEEAARWVEFMAYSGMRPGEIEAVRWEHIGPDSILVTGGVEGTKNRERRYVPIIPPMRGLLNGLIRKDGPVFTIKKPHEALKNACKRLGLPHQRIYDLRHLFASMCNQAGVDVPTFASWLGHRDGGTLAMRTYVHPASEHGKRSAEKVTF